MNEFLAMATDSMRQAMEIFPRTECRIGSLSSDPIHGVLDELSEGYELEVGPLTVTVTARLQLALGDVDAGSIAFQTPVFIGDRRFAILRKSEDEVGILLELGLPRQRR